MPPATSTKPPNKKPAKTGLTLALMVGGFILLIMIAGWLMTATRG
jgi:hypothetical protein